MKERGDDSEVGRNVIGGLKFLNPYVVYVCRGFERRPGHEIRDKKR
jgi:hypothetical protein